LGNGRSGIKRAALPWRRSLTNATAPRRRPTSRGVPPSIRRITDIDRRLKAEFPDYAALASAVPLCVAELQAELRADEALVLVLDTPAASPTPEESFIWVVTKTDVRWVRSELGTPALTREVAALRCGLDDAHWNKADSYDRCVELVKKHRYDVNGDGQTLSVLPLDHARAHKLYQGCSARSPT
jgi:hypothetical protein